jgi:hypothetical protein
MSRLISARPLGSLKSFLRELDMIVGFLSLGLACLLLHLEAKRQGRYGTTDQALGLLSVLMAGALAIIVSRKRPETIFWDP